MIPRTGLESSKEREDSIPVDMERRFVCLSLFSLSATKSEVTANNKLIILRRSKLDNALH